MHIRPPGSDRDMSAVAVTPIETGSANAWGAHGYQTVRLLADLPALRVHTRSGAAAATRPELAGGAGTLGRWFAIGDVILTRDDYQAAHALPAGFSHQDDWLLPAGTVLNVGIAGPLFGHPGGALQAERLSGPPPRHTPLAGYWANRAGNA